MSATNTRSRLPDHSWDSSSLTPQPLPDVDG